MEHCTLARAPGDSLVQKLPLHVQKAQFLKRIYAQGQGNEVLLTDNQATFTEKKCTKTTLQIVQSSDIP